MICIATPRRPQEGFGKRVLRRRIRTLRREPETTVEDVGTGRGRNPRAGAPVAIAGTLRSAAAHLHGPAAMA